MQVETTPIPGILIITPHVYRDERGFFLESFQDEKYRQAGIQHTFVQDNHSKSSKGVLRGLHGQRRHSQGKLVRAIQGEVFDVAVDLRRESPRFGQWFGLTLSAENFLQLYVPPGFAHGFCVLSETAEFEYKCTDYYCKEEEFAIQWDDPEIGIDWPLEQPQLSQRDQQAPPLAEVLPQLQGIPPWSG